MVTPEILKLIGKRCVIPDDLSITIMPLVAIPDEELCGFFILDKSSFRSVKFLHYFYIELLCLISLNDAFRRKDFKKRLEKISDFHPRTINSLISGFYLALENGRVLHRFDKLIIGQEIEIYRLD